MERYPELRKELRNRWHHPITVPVSNRPDFFMVVSFGRSKFKLTEASVSNLLNVCLEVTNKFIGFHIAKLQSFTFSNFVVYFHLWGFGGPDYQREFAALEEEDAQTWQDPKKPRSPHYVAKSYAEAVTRNPQLLTGANAIPIVRQSAFQRLTKPPSSPPLSPCLLTDEVDLADAGYSPEDIKGSNFPVDPAPLLPGQFDIINFPGRPQQCRYHVIGHIPAKNEDAAIINMAPAPNPDAPFHVTKDMIIDFLHGHLGIRFDHMQRSSLGHAIIRLNSTSNRDWLVLNSPHLHNDIQFTFTEHNRGINCRAFTYNQEVWLMLLNLPLDLWDSAHVHDAVAKWGKLISWDKTVSNLTRAIIKVRVETLADIQYSIIVSHGNNSNAESWSCPVYILSERLMGMEPPDEDVPPDNGGILHPLPALPFHQDHVQHAPIIPDLNEFVQWQPWPAPPEDVQQNHLPEDPLIAQNLMQFFDEVQNMPMAQDPMIDQNDDSAITLILSSNAPDHASAGSVN
ncbi:hypothetical protein BRADI_1g38061v3 [Brachypodium distachyon]|uniref:DUF7597 domain-containing protein n=1 Tax=Brachypodium distachyon TaxID=15368 RepID=A0A0Q3JK98_BRADI|nr:hypothetical protein BRADI_1g38061v3 [Brachypodium distachyon]